MEKTVKRQLNVVCDNIRLQRQLKSYTQGYMAQRLSISQNAFSKIELGVTQPTMKRIFQIAYILEIDVSDLIETNAGVKLNAMPGDNTMKISAAG